MNYYTINHIKEVYDLRWNGINEATKGLVFGRSTSKSLVLMTDLLNYLATAQSKADEDTKPLVQDLITDTEVALLDARYGLGKLYLDYVNSFLTVDGVAEYYGVSPDVMQIAVDKGRGRHEEIAATNKKIKDEINATKQLNK